MGQETKAAITAEEITQAQQTWGEGIVRIGKVFTDKGDYTKAAEEHIDTLYAFQSGDVLFKPTKAADKQFRLNREAALSYFVAGNDAFGEDHGFALQPWTNVRCENAAIFLHGDYAVAMGNYFFTTVDGDDVKVEYTFGYFKDDNGNLRINLHHSSIPFSG
ncbi:MAG: hypothetical protein KAI39_05010 [Desulfobulbaceae bacterium]|nr:hypothetical protein [Desulfobulbaceae bacterium]